jgi:hypothetical protein
MRLRTGLSGKPIRPLGGTQAGRIDAEALDWFPVQVESTAIFGLRIEGLHHP